MGHHQSAHVVLAVGGINAFLLSVCMGKQSVLLSLAKRGAPSRPNGELVSQEVQVLQAPRCQLNAGDLSLVPM